MTPDLFLRVVSETVARAAQTFQIDAEVKLQPNGLLFTTIVEGDTFSTPLYLDDIAAFTNEQQVRAKVESVLAYCLRNTRSAPL